MFKFRSVKTTSICFLIGIPLNFMGEDKIGDICFCVYFLGVRANRTQSIIDTLTVNKLHDLCGFWIHSTRNLLWILQDDVIHLFYR